MSEVRSYRSVFDLERRIYSVDRLRLNPGGVPVRGVAYFFGLLLCELLARRLPLLGLPARALPWYLGELALPGLLAAVLGVVRLEGRTFHHAAYALLRRRLTPRRLCGVHLASSVGRVWYPPEILLLPDGDDATLRRLRYTGPGAVLVGVAHERFGRVVEAAGSGYAPRGLGPELHIRASAVGGGQVLGEVISLAPGTRLLVHAGHDRGGR